MEKLPHFMMEDENSELFTPAFNTNNKGLLVINVGNLEQPDYRPNQNLQLNKHNIIASCDYPEITSCLGLTFPLNKEINFSRVELSSQVGRVREERLSVADAEEILALEDPETSLSVNEREYSDKCSFDEEDPNQDVYYQTRDFKQITVNERDMQGEHCDEKIYPLADERDPGIEAVLEIINGPESNNPAEFAPVDSSKLRNPPYLLKEDKKGVRIAAKNNEPVKFHLKGAKVCEMVQVSMRFSEEKHKCSPVFACPLHQNGSPEKYNFSVSSDGEKNWKYDEFLDHPTANLQLSQNNFDEFGDFNFFITFKCLNSCHKDYGKKVELLLHLFKTDGTHVKENRFEVRVCKNVKRDYKEAFPDEEEAPERRRKSVQPVQPEPFTCQEDPHPILSTSFKANEVVNDKTVKIQMLQPVGGKIIKEESQKEVNVECGPCHDVRKDCQKTYMIRLPSVRKERIILDTIREFGGDVFEMKSLIPAPDFPEEQD